MHSSYVRTVFLRIGAGTLRNSKGLEREEVAACYTQLKKALAFSLALLIVVGVPYSGEKEALDYSLEFGEVLSIISE